jgi:hypothetical protein
LGERGEGRKYTCVILRGEWNRDDRMLILKLIIRVLVFFVLVVMILIVAALEVLEIMRDRLGDSR